MAKRFLVFSFSIILIAGTGLSLLSVQLQTPAEKSQYLEGGTLYDPLMEFLYELDAQSELMNIQELTRTLRGRSLLLCILSDPPVYGPSDVEKTGRPVVLFAHNVHGSEVAGKDAGLEIMRDLIMGDLRPLLKDVTVLVIPTLNPDGAEERRRTNEQEFDMNRDYLKLESQEIHALVTKVFNTWHPDIHVDTHHGGADPYALVYQTCMNPAGDAELMRFGNEEILPRVREALRAEDYDGFWYSGGRWVDDSVQWTPTSVEPRKQHVYSGLSNMLGFLFETPGNAYRVINNGTEVVPVPREERYRHQVRGEYIGQREMIRFAAERGAELKQVIAEAKQRAIVLGNDDSDGDLIPLSNERREKFKEELWIRKPQGQPGEYIKVEGSVHTLFAPTKETVRPWGYLIPPQLAHVVPLLLDHEIMVKQLSDPVEVEVEVYYASEILHPEYFQGHYLKRIKAEKKVEMITMPAGSFFIPAGQQKSNLICYILEPETDDNLLTWGFLDNFVRVTPNWEQWEKEQKEEMESFSSGMTEEQLKRMESRLASQKARLSNQKIPVYRLMRKTGLKGMLVRPANGFEKNQYIR